MNSSCDTDSTSGERMHEVIEHDRHQVSFVGSAPSGGPSPLTTSTARHSHKHGSHVGSTGGMADRNSSHLSPNGPSGSGELRRHIVVKDGAPVLTRPNSSTGPHHYLPSMSRDNRSATPVDIASPGHMPHVSSSLPPQLTPDAPNHPVFKHRRSSSSSSLRSIKQLDDRKQPTPPLHQRMSSSSSSPLQQHQLLGAQLSGQPNLLAPQSSAGPAGIPRYPFPNPFLPGGNWLSAGGVLTATGLPPPVFSLDPNSPFKPVFNPGLLPYRYPFGMTQPLKPFSSQTPSPLSGTTTAQATSALHSMYPLANANLAAFQGANEAGGVGPGGPAPSLLPPLGTNQPPQPFPGMMPSQPLLPGSKEDKTEEKVPGLNWNPAALVGPGFGMMPYLMGQNQLGIGATGLGVPAGQPGVNLLNSSLSPSPMGDSGLGKLKDSVLLSRNPQLRRPSLTSGETSRETVHHRVADVSPSSTPPLGGNKISQFPLATPDAAKWKGVGFGEGPPTQQMMFRPTGASSPYPTSSMPGHVMPIGFSPAMGTNSPYLPKARGEGLGHGSSPRAVHDKVKLRIHQVRNDDFKMQVKPDRRRKNWRGKERNMVPSARDELTDSAVRRMGVGILATEPTHQIRDPPIRALPASLGVEPGSAAEKKNLPPPSTHTGDSNYALNILADMSSIQSKEAQSAQKERVVIQSKPLNGPPGPSTSETHLRSPVSLAARSLLMLGEDLNIPEGSQTLPGSRTGDVSQFENTAASSLLQLSGAKQSESTATKTQQSISAPSDLQTRSTRSASFSAAEAMIMMVSGSEKKPPESRQGQISTLDGRPPSSGTSVQKPTRLRLDSEATETDSEATLTPESPATARREFGQFPSFPSMDEGEFPANSGLGAAESALNEQALSGSITEASGEQPSDDPLIDIGASDEVSSDTATAPEDSSDVAGSGSPDQFPTYESLNRPPETSTAETQETDSVAPETVPISNAVKPKDDIFPLEDKWPTPSRHQKEDSPPVTPPPAKRPKFISTFGPAVSDGDAMGSLTLLGREGMSSEIDLPLLEGNRLHMEMGEKTALKMSPEREPNESACVPFESEGFVSTGAKTSDVETASPKSVEEAIKTADMDTSPLEEPPVSLMEGDQTAAASVGVSHSSGAPPVSNITGREVSCDLEKFPEKIKESTAEGMSVTRTLPLGRGASCGLSSGKDAENNTTSADDVDDSQACTTDVAGASSLEKLPTVTAVAGDVGVACSLPASEAGDGSSANPGKLTKKIKVVKRVSAGTKVKSAQGKTTRVIKIKRVKTSPKPSTTDSPIVESRGDSPSSWTDFADAASDTIGDSVCKSTAESKSKLDQSEDVFKDPGETVPSRVAPSDEGSSKDPQSGGESTKEPVSIAPQNRLKIAKGVGSHKPHQRPSSSSQLAGKGEGHAPRSQQSRDLFSTSVPAAKKEASKVHPKKDLFAVDSSTKNETPKKQSGKDFAELSAAKKDVSKPQQHRKDLDAKKEAPKPQHKKEVSAGDSKKERAVHRKDIHPADFRKDKDMHLKELSTADFKKDSLKMVHGVELDSPEVKKDLQHSRDHKDAAKPKKLKSLASSSGNTKAAADKGRLTHQKVPDGGDVTPVSASSHDYKMQDSNRGSTHDKHRSHLPITKAHLSPGHSPLSFRGRDEFSPLSDNELSFALKCPEDTHSEGSEYRGRKHQINVEESSVPSPSSALEFKKHYHHHRRHHNHSGSAASGKHDHSPDRKRHHQRHHRHSHHSHDSRDHSSSRYSKGEVQKRPYESISDDEAFNSVTAGKDKRESGKRGLHDLSSVAKSSGRKRRRISSDDISLDEESEGVVLSESDRHHSKHKKSKHSSKEHKQRWKEQKHKHSHKEH